METLASAPFEPLHNCSLKYLTLKTVFLVSLASGRRRGAIQALSASRGHLNFLPHGVRLIPEPAFLAKNQTVDFLPHPIFILKISSFSSVREDKVWCPVRALSWYVERTKAFRTPTQMALFLTHRAPHGRASASTISRWIVEAISANPRSLTGPGTPRAHDVRGVAASWALFQGVPLDEILRSAVWKNPNSFLLFDRRPSGRGTVWPGGVVRRSFHYYRLLTRWYLFALAAPSSRPLPPSVLSTVGHSANIQIHL